MMMSRDFQARETLNGSLLVIPPQSRIQFNQAHNR